MRNLFWGENIGSALVPRSTILRLAEVSLEKFSDVCVLSGGKDGLQGDEGGVEYATITLYDEIDGQVPFRRKRLWKYSLLN